MIAVVGALASIIGAAVSIWNAYKSERAAEVAKTVRSQLVDHRKASELSNLHTICKKALKSMEKYGPGSIPSTLKGVNPESDARDVQDLVLSLREHRGHFGAKDKNDADNFCDSITPILNAFAQANDHLGYREHGQLILTELSNLASIIKIKLERKKEKVH